MHLKGIVVLCLVGLLTVNASSSESSSSSEETKEVKKVKEVKEAKKEPKDAVKCEDPVAHYFEMGCRPVYSKRSGKCPMKFECPGMNSRSDKLCYYKRNSYPIGEAIGQNVIEHTCTADCTCIDGYEGRAQLTCANIECSDVFVRPKPNCVRQYRPKECCSYKEVCEEAEIKSLKTCEWEGKVYREGEKFYPSDECTTCICNKDFDGTLKSLKCATINCGIELHSGHYLRDKCAPIYFEGRNCCPIDWRCAKDEDEIAEVMGNISNGKCTYGKHLLNVGDSVITNDECVSCKCSVPPLVTCTRAKNC